MGLRGWREARGVLAILKESGLADLRSCNNETRLIGLFFIAIDFIGFIGLNIQNWIGPPNYVIYLYKEITDPRRCKRAGVRCTISGIDMTINGSK